MRSALEFPLVREAPEHVLRGLRDIDPTAELLYWGLRPTEIDGVTVPRPVWVLGTVHPTRTRQAAGAAKCATQEALGLNGDKDEWRLGKLLYQGFATVGFYLSLDPTSAIVEDFRKRDWLYRFGFEEEWERSSAVSEGIPQQEARIRLLQDRRESEGPSIWKFAMGKRRSFAVN